MSVNSLGEGSSIPMPAHGMFQIQVHSLGSGEPVRLDVRGDATANRVDDSTLKVVDAGSASDIVLSPTTGRDFGPGRSAQVIVTRGRPGSEAAHSVEFPRVTLDGHSEITVGRITSDGGTLTLHAEGSAAETRLAGPSATVRAALRSAIAAEGVRVPAGLGMVVHVDRSASMSAPSVMARVRAATDIVIGAASVVAPGAPVRIVAGGDSFQIDSAADVTSEAMRLIGADTARIGGAEDVGDGRDDLTFVISDAVPADIADGASNAVALMLRPLTRPAAPAVVEVGEDVERALDEGRPDGLGRVVAAVIGALRGMHGETAPVSPASPSATGAAPASGAPAFRDTPSFPAAPAFPSTPANPTTPASPSTPTFRETPSFESEAPAADRGSGDDWAAPAHSADHLWDNPFAAKPADPDGPAAPPTFGQPSAPAAPPTFGRPTDPGEPTRPATTPSFGGTPTFGAATDTGWGTDPEPEDRDHGAPTRESGTGKPVTPPTFGLPPSASDEEDDR